jgi:anti-sigma B factor antagonist
MRISEKIHDNITVLTISGKMMIDAKSSDLHKYVKELIAKNQTNIVIDLGKVTWLASVGLGAILASYTSLKNASGDLKLARSTRKIRSVLIFTQLTKVLEDFDTVQEAVNSF